MSEKKDTPQQGGQGGKQSDKQTHHLGLGKEPGEVRNGDRGSSNISTDKKGMTPPNKSGKS